MVKPRGTFQVPVHHLPKRKRKYYYKCKVGSCKATFDKTTAWNAHHLVRHKDTIFRCGDCRKVLCTPSSFKNQLAVHKECHFACNRCDRKFVFQSELATHHSLHRRQRIHSCFAANCSRSYKWRHYLLWHIKVHTKKILYSCKLCKYESYKG